MAIYGAFTHCGLFINGVDLTGVSNTVKAEMIKEVKERNVFGNTGKVREMAGLGDVNFTAAGFHEAAQDSLLRATYGTNTINTAFIISSASKTATAAGDLAFFFQGTQPQYSTGEQHGNDLLWGLNLQGGGNGYGIIAGKALNVGTTAITADGNGTGVVMPAASATQYVYAMLQVLEVSADDSIVVTIESDDNADFTSATTRFTFDSASAIGAQYPARLAGAITDTYWRAVYDVTGADVSIKCAVLLGIQ
jgi:hypothetical protein